jgi:hypothetical protein
MNTFDMSNIIQVQPDRTSPKMTKPHRDGTNGQYNDEYDENAFEKMGARHFVPRKINYDEWEATPNIANLPPSCDDEMFDDYIVTTVDLTMVRNAAANALSALVSKTFDSDVQVTEENCLKVSLYIYLFNFQISLVDCMKRLLTRLSPSPSRWNVPHNSTVGEK